MWPSLEAATRVSDWANVALVVSLVCGVIATGLIVWAAGVKEAHWDSDRQQSRERVAGLDAAVAEANTRAAEANQKAEGERLARVRIEERLAPRVIRPEQLQQIVAALSRFPGTAANVWIAGETEEIGALSRIILMALQLAKWDAQPWTWTGVGPILGVVIATKDGSDSKTVEAATAVGAALNSVGVHTSFGKWPPDWDTFGGMLNGVGSPTSAPIRIIVGAKPE